MFSTGTHGPISWMFLGTVTETRKLIFLKIGDKKLYVKCLKKKKKQTILSLIKQDVKGKTIFFALFLGSASVFSNQFVPNTF